MNKLHLVLASSLLALGMAGSAQAQCVGNCGVGSANGDITASPLGGGYRYVSTSGGVAGGGSLGIGSETDGSQETSAVFSASAGSMLTFYFNYVTSDGSGFADYGWSQLRTAAGAPVATLFTARTTPSGDTVPGFGLPGLLATLTPVSTPIQLGAFADGPTWAQLGGDSGSCFSGRGNGCGFTGWIRADYTIETAGNYRLVFGVTNWSDTAFDSGMAYDGITVDGEVINAIPEPATWVTLITGFGLVGAAARRRRTMPRTA